MNLLLNPIIIRMKNTTALNRSFRCHITLANVYFLESIKNFTQNNHVLFM